MLCLLPGAAAAQTTQDQSDGSESTPSAAAQTTAPAQPLPQTSTVTAIPAQDMLQSSASPQAEPEPAVVRFLAHQRDALGRRCQLHHTARSGALRLLACGAAGLWIVRLGDADGDTPVVVSQQDLGGTVERFFQVEDRLWVEISSVRAQQVRVGDAIIAQRAQAPAAQSSSEAAAAAAGPQSEPPQQSQGAVVSQSDEELLVLLPNPVRPGDHIALIGPDSDRPIDADEQQVLAVGAVTRSWQDGRARVAIGTNEMVPLTAAARPTSAPTTAGSFAPPRAAGMWEVGFLARPFLILEDLGVGAMIDAYVGYRARAPYHLEVSISPLAFGFARAGTVGAAAAFVSGSFDTRLFELGLGVGAQTVNQPEFALDPGSGLLLSEQIRVGARDGAHLRFVTYVALFHSNFHFSSVRVEGQIPLSARTWLRLAAGGGTLGFGFGEIGLRLLMSGNGGSGSFFFTAVAGGGHLFRDCNTVPQANGAQARDCAEANHAGPMLGAGGEFRL